MVKKTNDLISFGNRFVRALMLVVLSAPFFFLVIVIPCFLNLLTRDAGERMSERFCMIWYKVLFWVFGIKLIVKRKGKIPDGKFIVFSNHLSFIDIPAIALAFPNKRIKFLAKETVRKYPFVGLGLFVQRHPIVRKGVEFVSVRTAMRSLERADCLCVFPEGTRGKSSKTILPFKDGISFIHQMCSVPLVPVFISGTEFVLPGGAILPKRGVVTVKIGEPIFYRNTAETMRIDALRKDHLKAISEDLRKRLEILMNENGPSQ